MEWRQVSIFHVSSLSYCIYRTDGVTRDKSEFRVLLNKGHHWGMCMNCLFYSVVNQSMQNTAREKTGMKWRVLLMIVMLIKHQVWQQSQTNGRVTSISILLERCEGVAIISLQSTQHMGSNSTFFSLEFFTDVLFKGHIWRKKWTPFNKICAP